jgi:hypothetical protein
MSLSNGLYKVAFQTPMGGGSGVVTIENGILLGGDSMMYYVGKIVEDGDEFTAEVMSKTHTNVPGMGSVFGVAEALINLKGSSSGRVASAKGSSPQAPGVGFNATLEKLH